MENLPKLPGNGIIYYFTVPDTGRVIGWLKQNGFFVEAYYIGEDKAINSPALKQSFLSKKVLSLLLTWLLARFDEPDTC
jgi:ATP-dependent DNA helicase RecQ